MLGSNKILQSSQLLITQFHLLLLIDFILIDSTKSRSTSNCVSSEFIDCSIPDTEVYPTNFELDQAKKSLDFHNPDGQADGKRWDDLDKFEGDILGHTARSVKSLVSLTYAMSKPHPENSARNAAITDPYKLWNDATIPYAMSSQFTDRARGVIARAIEDYHNNTCLKFVPRTNERDYIYLNAGGWGCASYVGRQRGVQYVDLGNGCIGKGTIVHEIMHAIGFFHEQSRADRDYYVNIYPQNARKGFRSQFEKYDLSKITHLNTPYDFNSIMHYSMYAFSKQRGSLPTVVPKDQRYKIGQRNGLSRLDIEEINRLYQCPEANSVKQTIPIFCKDGQWLDCLIHQQHEKDQSQISSDDNLELLNGLVRNMQKDTAKLSNSANKVPVTKFVLFFSVICYISSFLSDFLL